MALIECPECGREISDKSTQCPYCGLPRSSYHINKIDNTQAQTYPESTSQHIPTTPKPNSGLAEAIIVSVCNNILAVAVIKSIIFLVFAPFLLIFNIYGMLAIIHASRTISLWHNGNYTDAYNAARCSRKWLIYSVATINIVSISIILITLSIKLTF
ncbi:MAG: zinc-ribbon domain-containing protein [Alistipes sp.]|nr:zinc-ribbon domain-containing protein [Alistipes sp.]